MERQEDAQIVKPATAPPTRAHKKAGRMGRRVLGAAMIAGVLTAIGYVVGSEALVWGAAGAAIALLAVGLLLEMESERQRQSAQNPAERRPPPNS